MDFSRLPRYKTSKDYKQLKDLLDEGYEVICISYGRLFLCKSFGNGYCFSEYAYIASNGDFEKTCRALSLEYIEPNDKF